MYGLLFLIAIMLHGSFILLFCWKQEGPNFPQHFLRGESNIEREMKQ